MASLQRRPLGAGGCGGAPGDYDALVSFVAVSTLAAARQGWRWVRLRGPRRYRGLGWFYWHTYLLYPLPSIGGGCGCWSGGAMCICMYTIRGYVWRWLRLLEAAALDTSFTIYSTWTAASHVVHRMHQLRGSH